MTPPFRSCLASLTAAAGHRFLLVVSSLTCIVVSTPAVLGQRVPADDSQPEKELLLRDFRPRAMLKVPATRLERARFPVVDVHTHFRFKLRSPVEDYVAVMDRQGIAVCVSLDGKVGDAWQDHADLLWTRYRKRFLIFVYIDWLGDGQPDRPESWDCNRPDFGRRTALQIADAKNRGASGIKVFKSLGLDVPALDGTPARIDDPRWDPIWQVCGELQMPVLIHSADPAAFFEPVDATNERWEELQRHPDWSFHDPKYPRREELLAARNRVIERHPQTTFIGAHVANNPEDLAEVSRWLDRYPNLYVDIASRIGELGRQPRTCAAFLPGIRGPDPARYRRPMARDSTGALLAVPRDG